MAAKIPNPDDDRFDQTTSEFINQLQDGALPATVDDVRPGPNVVAIDVTLPADQRDAATALAARHDFKRRGLSVAATSDDDVDQLSITFVRRRDASATSAPSRSADRSDDVVLPPGWTHRRERGDDVFEHAETGLSVRVFKRSGRSGKATDYHFNARIRDADGQGEPLLPSTRPDRDAVLAAVAKFTAATPDGDYAPSDHAPQNPWDWDRPRWPDALGVDDPSADPTVWLQPDDSEGRDA